MRTRDAVAAACLVTLAAPLWAQHADHVSSGLRVVVDGRTSPEEIPDLLAYSHFLLAAASNDGTTPVDVARRTSLLEPVQLAADDATAFDTVITDLRKQLDFIAGAVDRLSSEPRSVDIDAKLVNFKLQRTRVLDEAMARLDTKLSKEGSDRLNAYVRTEFKKTIAIFGDSTP